MKSDRDHSKSLFWCLLGALLGATVICYWPVLGAQFINFDDNSYITNNPHVNGGLSLAGVRWAFTSFYMSNWHPLTWLGHMAAVSLFGMNASGHHALNLALHLINIGLLFYVLLRSTGALFRSFLVAALFALHPMHIESVAWVAELKDVLSTLFWFGTTLFYIFYTENRRRLYYWLSVGAFILGLLSKPMIVTLPFTLLLFDFWPLRRIPLRITFAQAVSEKIPFFILTLASSVITYLAQKAGGAVATAQNWSPDMGLWNSILNYALYLWKWAVPLNPTIFYPTLYTTLPLRESLGALLLLAGLTVCFLKLNRRHPFLLTGWFWFLGTLVPVIGLVKIGTQQIADRYTYIPYIGLFIIFAWTLEEFSRRGAWQKFVTIGLVSAFLLALAVQTRLNTPYWQNQIRLYERSLALTTNNFLIHINLGHAYLNENNLGKAESELQKSMKIRSDIWNAPDGLGVISLRRGKSDEAIGYFKKAIILNPRQASIYFNLGAAYSMQKDYPKAEEYFNQAIQLAPAMANAYAELGLIRYRACRIDEALTYFRDALRVDPKLTQAQNYLEFLKPMEGKPEEAQKKFCSTMETVETIKSINSVTQNLDNVRKATAPLKNIPKLPKF